MKIQIIMINIDWCLDMTHRKDFNEGYTLTSKELEFRTDDLMSAVALLSQQNSDLLYRLKELEDTYREELNKLRGLYERLA